MHTARLVERLQPVPKDWAGRSQADTKWTVSPFSRRAAPTSVYRREGVGGVKIQRLASLRQSPSLEVADPHIHVHARAHNRPSRGSTSSTELLLHTVGAGPPSGVSVNLFSVTYWSE